MLYKNNLYKAYKNVRNFNGITTTLKIALNAINIL